MSDGNDLPPPPKGFGGARPAPGGLGGAPGVVPGVAPGQVGASGASWHSGPEGMSAPLPSFLSAGRGSQAAIDRLGPEGRSILVPGVILLVLLLGGAIATSIGFAGLVRAAVDTDAFEIDEGTSGLTATGADEVACGVERGRVERGIEAFTLLEGRPPEDASELVPRFLDQEPSNHRVVVVGGEARAVAERGSICAPVRSDRDGGDRARDVVDAVGEASAVGLYLAGSVALAIAVGYQGWWLATAYRCLPRSRQNRSPSSAYRPLVVYAVSALISGCVTVSLVSSEVAFEEPFFANVVVLAMSGAFGVAMFFALRRVVEMIGDVTYHFSDGHYLTSRVMRICLSGVAYGTATAFFLVTVLGVAGATGGVAAVVLLWYLAVLVLVPSGFVAYLVAVVLSVLGVERALRAAAAEMSAPPVGA